MISIKDCIEINTALLENNVSTVISPTQIEFIIEIDDYRLVEVRKFKYYPSRNAAWWYGASNIIKNLEKYLESK